MIAALEKLVNEYIGVLVFPSKVTLASNTWDILHWDNLTGIIAFTKWSIPQKKAFYDCEDLTFILGVCPTLGVDMFCMFCRASSFNQPLNKWDVSSVTDMCGMFHGASGFNQPLNDWDVSSVTDMRYMFEGASSFNQPLNDWDVSSVTNMIDMFSKASNFNQPLNDWDVSSVTYMRYMFFRASGFNQPLNDWDVSSVISIYCMFKGSKMLQLPEWLN